MHSEHPTPRFPARAVHPSHAMINRDALVPGRRRDPSERPGHARDALPQRVGTVRMGCDARDRSPYACATQGSDMM
eukprot:7391463-Prymnesium_polylepis.1